LDCELEVLVVEGAVLSGERGGDGELLPAEVVVVFEREVGGQRRAGSLWQRDLDGFERDVGTDRKLEGVTPFLIAVWPSRITVMPSP
jgi:hypothetical protein